MRKILFILLMLMFFDVGANDNIANEIFQFFKKTEYSQVAEIIVSMTILESNWYRSKTHQDKNNFFSLKDFKNPMCCKNLSDRDKCSYIRCMKKFSNIQEANEYMLKYFKRKGYSIKTNEFLGDLIKFKYAEDPEYIEKVKGVNQTIRRRRILKTIIKKEN